MTESLKALSGAVVIGSSLETGPYARLKSGELAQALAKIDPLLSSVEVEDKPEGDTFRVTLGARSANVSLASLTKCVLAGDVDTWVTALKGELAPGGVVESAEDLVRRTNEARDARVADILAQAREHLSEVLVGTEGPLVALRLSKAELYDLTPPEGFSWTSGGGPFRLAKAY